MFEAEFSDHDHKEPCPGCGSATEYLKATLTTQSEMESRMSSGRGPDILIRGKRFDWDPKCRLNSFAGAKRTGDRQQKAEVRAMEHARKAVQSSGPTDASREGSRITSVFPSAALFARKRQFGADYIKDPKEFTEREGFRFVKD